MSSAKIIGQTPEGEYKVNVKPDNVKQGDFGAGGRVVSVDTKEHAQELVDFYNNKPDVSLEKAPSQDVFTPSAKVNEEEIKAFRPRAPRSAQKQLASFMRKLKEQQKYQEDIPTQKQSNI